MLSALARFCYRRRGAVVISWVIVLVAAFAISGLFGGEFRQEFSLPGSESDEAVALLESSGFDTRTGEQGQIVFEAEQGVNDPTVRAEMEQLFATVAEQVPGASVVSPYTPEGAHQISESGAIAYAEVNLAERTREEYIEAGDQIRELRDGVEAPGLAIELGGDRFVEEQAPASSEVIGIVAAAIILLIAFGSVLAMGLPIVTALFGVGIGVALIGLVTHAFAVPDFAPAAAAMIGIGAGIDYALFIVTRFRQGLDDGLEPEDAAALATNTAGRAVLFAGTTVVISVMGLMLMELDTFQSVAVAAALGVLFTMLAAVTLLPAFLGFVRHRIDKWRLPFFKHGEGQTRRSIWYRWSRVIQRRPWPALVVGLTLLLVLAVPALDLRLGFADAGNRAETDTTRRAYDLLSEGFGPGFNGPLILAASLPGGERDLAAVQELSDTLNSTPGVAYAAPPQLNEAGDAAIVIAIPATAPQDAETAALIDTLRDDLVPAATAGSSAEVKVGGMQAVSNDFVDYTAEQMPIFVGAVLLLSFLLLMVVFRSLLVPLKAVIMNLLSIGAAFGVIVAIFQWGWGASLMGVGREGPIEVWAPVMLFAIVFGLSMDYEVFLLSRIREEYDRTGENDRAVADGLAATARVITAAALIMVSVFSSFVLGDDRALKLMGMGLAVAVFIDATIVRLILVPATMELLGKANWWLPRWLDRRLPSVNVEAPSSSAGSTPLRGAEATVQFQDD